MDAAKKSIQSVIAKRKTVLFLLGGAVVAGLIAQLSDRTTARYWNNVYALAHRADAVKNLETPAEVIAVLGEIEEQLARLNRNRVDPRALDSANRFGVALVAARQSVESGQYLIDHPVRTALKSTATLVGGRSPLRELRDRLAHVRDVTLEAYEHSKRAYSGLSWRYPLSHFEAPIPPDVHLMDELLHELDKLEAEDRSLRDQVFSLGRLLGALLPLLLGG